MKCKSIVELNKIYNNDLLEEIHRVTIDDMLDIEMKGDYRFPIDSPVIIINDEKIPVLSLSCILTENRFSRDSTTLLRGKVKNVFDDQERGFIAQLLGINLKPIKEKLEVDYTEEDLKYIPGINSSKDLEKVLFQIFLFSKGIIQVLDIPNPIWAINTFCTGFDGNKYNGWDVYTYRVHDNFILKEFDISLYQRYKSGAYKHKELKIVSPRIKKHRIQVNGLQLIRNKVVQVYTSAFIYIMSSYRSDNLGIINGNQYYGLNGLIGGSSTSNHCSGEADDIDLRGIQKHLNVTDRKIAEGLINVCIALGCVRIELTSGNDHIVHVNFVGKTPWYAKQVYSSGSWSYPNVIPIKEWPYKLPRVM